jgi:hypothetical protein
MLLGGECPNVPKNLVMGQSIWLLPKAKKKEGVSTSMN